MNTTETTTFQTERQPLPNLTYGYQDWWDDHPVLRAAYVAAHNNNYTEDGFPNMLLLDGVKYLIGVLPELVAAHYALVSFTDHMEDVTELFAVMRAIDAAVMAECKRVEEVS